MYEYLRRKRESATDDGFVRFLRAELTRRHVYDRSALADGSFAMIAIAGPAHAGKSSYARRLHALLETAEKTPLVASLPRAGALSGDVDFGMHLWFDVATPTRGVVRIATVPGSVPRDSARKELLSRASAVIFLADAQPERAAENRIAFAELAPPESALPVVLGRSKHDLPNARSVDDLFAERALDVNPRTGRGVIELFEVTLCKLVREP